MKIGIIGHASDKFNEKGKYLALKEINYILDTFKSNDIFVSGRCPMGGIDIWSEEQAIKRKIETDIKAPKQHVWNAEYGFKQRNLDIAQESKRLYVILVSSYPENYGDMKFEYCYHCNLTNHIKSGACWTAKKAKNFGNEVIFKIINQEGKE